MGQRCVPARTARDRPADRALLPLSSRSWSRWCRGGPRTRCRTAPARYGRTLLTTLSVTTACAALGFVATLEIDERVGPFQASGLISILALGIVLRIVVNQVRGTHAQREVHDALDQKELALRETDKALARLQRANETLRESEERLRTVFEAAVDGIVELDGKDVIVRANGAFCRMIELPQGMVEGQPWTALADSIEADDSFGSLPATGQGTSSSRGSRALSRVADVGDPGRTPAAAAARTGRDGGAGRRPDDPVAVQVPAGPRRGPHADHAPDERRDRERAQPHRARPPRRAGSRRLGRIPVARGRAPDAGRGRPRRGHRGPRKVRRELPKRPTTSAG